MGSVLLVLLAVHRPARVEACSYFPTWDGFVGYPGAGAENVPIDVVPIYRNPLQDLPAYGSVSFTLESEDGAGVALQVRAVASETQARWTELVPAAPLRPNTRYRLRGHAEYNRDKGYTLPARDSSLEFTTGATNASPALSEPAIEVQHLLPGLPDACFAIVRPGTCLILPDEAWYEVDGLASSSILVRGASFVDFLGDYGRNPCVTLRRRAPNASLGPARMVCRDQGLLFHKDDFDNLTERVQCAATGLILNGAPIGEALSPVPPEQWADLLRGPGTPEAGVEDAGVAWEDAGGSAQPQQAWSTSAARAAAGASATSRADPAAGEMQDEEANAGCSVSARQPRVVDLMLAVSVLALLRRRRRVG